VRARLKPAPVKGTEIKTETENGTTNATKIETRTAIETETETALRGEVVAKGVHPLRLVEATVAEANARAHVLEVVAHVPGVVLEVVGVGHGLAAILVLVPVRGIVDMAGVTATGRVMTRRLPTYWVYSV